MEILNVVSTLTLIQIFCKAKTFLKKLDNCFVVESTKIENALFPYKIALSEANGKTNRMANLKMDLSERKEFYHYLLYFFKNFVSV